MASSMTRPVARQACDECRARKRKCGFLEDDPDETSRLSWPPNQELPDGEGRSCRSCARLGVNCTFLVPAKTRGRKRKLRQDSVGSVHSATPGEESRDSEALSTGGSPVESSNAQYDQAPLLGRSPYVVTPAQSNGAHASPANISSRAAPNGSKYRTDELCSRDLLLQMMDDYLEHLYPVHPIVHRPTFRADLARNRDVSDPEFSALVVCLAALTVGLLPGRFQAYRATARQNGLRFETRTDMINKCFDMDQRARGPDYFDRISLRKWACSYLISIALFQTGQRNRSRMAEVESIQLALMLGLHRIEEYKDLNCIETQLRKKAFWIMFYGYVHLELQNLRRDIITFLDAPLIRQIKLEDLMPADVDDEMILEHSILPTVSTGKDISPSLTTGFILHSRVFWAALRGGASPLPYSGDFCECGNMKGSTRSPLHLAHWRERLYELKYMLDDIPSPLRQWDQSSPKNGQYEIVRANLHVTSLWLQVLIMDKVESVLHTYGDNSSTPSVIVDATVGEQTSGEDWLSSVDKRWAERDFICRQLLHVLHSVAYEHLEPNGLYLAHKIRDVAVSLLDCPFAPHEAPARRAAAYVQEFTRFLSQLDGSELPNTLSVQSWVDSDREPMHC